MHQDDIKYGEASLRASDSFTSQVKSELNRNLSDNSLKFLKYTELIPNWETYLTTKQLESAKKFITLLNSNEVDYQLNLNQGTTHQRLFGSKTSKGALGRLEEVYEALEEKGYYEQIKKKKEAAQAAKKVKKQRLSPKTIESVRELITLIVDYPEYEKYLTKSQAEKVHHFIRLRNFQSTARHCGITQEALKRALIGQGGVLDKLKEETSKNTVNSWDEI